MELSVVSNRFEILGPPLKGGMGSLYRARDTRFRGTRDRIVAIKMMREGLDAPDLVRRFEQEADAAGGLNHENIVKIFDVGRHEGIPYIVMEFVEGDTLAAVIRRSHPVDLADALGWSEALCKGLAYAHQHGIVHRDIKPANLMIDSHTGTLKILDFGIAKVHAAVGATTTGMAIGTAHYMSPEQVRGDAQLDHRSDIFSVGAVIYELLTARKAFPGSDYAAITYRILTQPVEPITQSRADVPRKLVGIVTRALEKDRDRRYRSLEETIEDLRSVARSLQSRAGGTDDDDLWVPAADDSAGEVRELLDAARALIAQGSYPLAASALKDVVARDSTNQEAAALLADVQERLTQRKRREDAARALEAGKRQASEGHWTAAYRIATQALDLDPSLTPALQLRDHARSVIDERRRREELEREAWAAVERAWERFNAGAREEAVRSLEAFDPPHTTVRNACEKMKAQLAELARIETEREKQRQRALALAETALRANRFTEADAAIDAAAGCGLPAAAVEEWRSRIDLARAEAARQAALARQVSELRARVHDALARRQFAEAAAAADQALALAPDDAAIAALRETAAAAFERDRAERELALRVAAVLQDARRVAAGDLPAAITLLQNFEPAVAEVLQAKKELEAEHARQEEARREEARREEARREEARREEARREEERRRAERELARRIAAVLQDARRAAVSDLPAAIALLQTFDPAVAEVLQLKQELEAEHARREEEARREEARREEARREEARREAARLRAERELARRVAAVVQDARRTALSDLPGAIALLQNFEPAVAEVVQARQELEAEQARKEEARREEARRRDDERRRADERRREEERQRQEAQQREEQRLRELAIRAEEERREAEIRARAEEERRRAQIEEESRRLQEAIRQNPAAEVVEQSSATVLIRDVADAATVVLPPDPAADAPATVIAPTVILPHSRVPAAEVERPVASSPAGNVAGIAVPDVGTEDDERPVAAVRPRRWPLAAAAALALAAVSGWLMWERTPTTPAAPVPTLGAAVVDATPWARIEQVRDSNGSSMPLPADAATPMTLRLPIGRYRVVLVGPPPENERREVQIEISSGTLQPVAPEVFRTIEAEQYLMRALSGEKPQ